MCPMCTATAATVAAGVTSSGALAAFLVAALRHKPARPSRPQPDGDDNGTAENRDA